MQDPFLRLFIYQEIEPQNNSCVVKCAILDGESLDPIQKKAHGTTKSEAL